MSKAIMERMPATPDLNQERLDQLRAVMPDLFTNDGALNPDELKRLVDPDLVPESERFEFRWFGKANAKRNAFTPTLATLEYDQERSVNPELAEGNAIIEGENLEVLKCLLASYRNRIKCIYIDPPYNKDKDFVYSDVWKVDKEAYWEHIGVTSEGVKVDTNTKADGRFHSNWLNMLYSRLLLSRQLLRTDGTIFISIDDNEIHHLRKLCDEVFGEENKVGTIVWKNATDNNPSNIAEEHEYVLVYCRDKTQLSAVWKTQLSDIKEALVKKGEELVAEHSDLDALQAAYTNWYRENKQFLWPLDRYKYIDRGGVYTGSQSVHNPGKEGYRYDVPHPVTGKPCKEPLMGYRFPPETMEELLAAERILFGHDENKIIELKVYAHEFQDKLSSVFELDGRLGPYDLKTLFPEHRKVFTNPKPVNLLSHIIPFVLDDGDIVLDFFAGSGPTAQAIIETNAKDNGKRRFILVQLPEMIDERDEPFKAGFKCISDITIERNKRVVSRIEETALEAETKTSGKLHSMESSYPPFRTGFKVYRLAKSRFPRTEFEPDPDKTDEENIGALDVYIREKEASFLMTFNQGDILHEVLLKNGFMLNVKTEVLVDFTENAVLRAWDSQKKATVCLYYEFKEQTIAKLKGLEGIFICLEQALNTTKKWNLRSEFGERLVAF
ncbi:MAG: site-specific DNA-methyltransferase [Gammaproteobacteria bacterium]|nr:site-specific DNA-methyltransferase [Gammaproteobacteria bacterium]MYH86028.1 site-specific DNA-methyltransferase [Gammaproteobacteria bacterium]MYK04113.1 site-specific DNA-methyltransferase [Gammaproteobacteria bacterium]